MANGIASAISDAIATGSSAARFRETSSSSFDRSALRCVTTAPSSCPPASGAGRHPRAPAARACTSTTSMPAATRIRRSAGVLCSASSSVTLDDLAVGVARSGPRSARPPAPLGRRPRHSNEDAIGRETAAECRRRVEGEQPFLEHRDAIGEALGFGEVVGRDEHGTAGGPSLGEQAPHGARALRIQAGGRLVEEQDRGIVQQRPRDGHLLPHALRTAPPRAPFMRAELEHVEQGADARVRLRPVRRARRRPAGSRGRSGDPTARAPR